MTFSVGSLVSARGREWVVLPGSEPPLVMVRPLGGTDEEVTGIDTSLEPLAPSSFSPPDPTRDLGDHRACAMLRDAVRLGFRAGAGALRSLARIAVEPRPYQLVPLLMALRQRTVRILIADDVGIGKTIEASLIARELLDRAEIDRLAVLCPPHLAEPWRRTLREQFHIDAVSVLASTAARLERDLGPGVSLFERHPFTVVSMDYIKSERRRHEFLRACPEFVIVDEAHGCASSSRGGQQRYELLRRLADDPTRHLVLVTATPHGGNEQGFRSLLGLLDGRLANLPEDLSGPEREKDRTLLAQFLVQRRRADLRGYLKADTPFPERDIADASYVPSPAFRDVLRKVLAWCRERIYDSDIDRRRQRVRWWAALALLRALSSSPRAAAATLRTRAAGAEDDADPDDRGRRALFDQDDDEGSDTALGGDVEADAQSVEHRRLLALAREVEALEGAKDAKLARGVELVQELVRDGFNVVVFCRFIPTTAYVADALRKKLKDVHVEVVTGELSPDEREARIEGLSAHPRRVLVCTDCLSEGINLQRLFDAVLHYDLTWNPTRLEQREGRVDRYQQPSPRVRAVLLYGKGNPVDGLVLDVILRRHRAIQKSLGVSVPIPVDNDALMEALFEASLLRKGATDDQLPLPFLRQKESEVTLAWEDAAARESRARTLFAQGSIKLDEVAAELDEARRVIGDASLVERFTRGAIHALGGTVTAGRPPLVLVGDLGPAARDAIRHETDFPVAFAAPTPPGAELLTRTHPVVDGLSAYVVQTALDARQPGVAARCGVIRTKAVAAQTFALLLRLRFHILTPSRHGGRRELLAEELVARAWRGAFDDPQWLDDAAVEALLDASPDANIAPDLARPRVARVVAALPALLPGLEGFARSRAAALREAHRRVRKLAGDVLRGLEVEALLPVDVLGVYVYVPAVVSAEGAS